MGTSSGLYFLRLVTALPGRCARSAAAALDLVPRALQFRCRFHQIAPVAPSH
jgi:hypothetical protein